MSSTELVKSDNSSGLSEKAIIKNSSCGLAVLKNSTIASRARSNLLLMLPLVSKITPSETGISSPEKCRISCGSLPSKTLKLSFSNPVTGRFMRSVMVTGRSTRCTSTLMGLLRAFKDGSSEDLSSTGCRLELTCTSSVSVCARRAGMSNELAVTPIANKTRKCAERLVTLLHRVKNPAPVANQLQTENTWFRLGTTPSPLSLGRPVCLGSCPKRSSQQNQVLDQKLPGIAQDWKTILKLRGAWR